MKKKEELVKKLIAKCQDRIRSFSKRYIIHVLCRKDANHHRRHIYLCENLCNKKCSFFREKMYICQQLHCANVDSCVDHPEEKRRKICKKRGYLEDRELLEKDYKAFLLIYKIFRGLKINSEQTLKFLRKRKKRTGAILPEQSNGKIEEKKDLKKKKVRRK